MVQVCLPTLNGWFLWDQLLGHIPVTWILWVWQVERTSLVNNLIGSSYVSNFKIIWQFIFKSGQNMNIHFTPRKGRWTLTLVKLMLPSRWPGPPADEVSHGRLGKINGETRWEFVTHTIQGLVYLPRFGWFWRKCRKLYHTWMVWVISPKE